MRTIICCILFLLISASALAQKPDDILATAKGHTIRLSDLSPEIRKAVVELPSTLAKARSNALDQYIFDSVLDAEAKAQNSTANALILAEKAKVPQPTEAEIKTVYDANRAAIGDRTLDEARHEIVRFIRGTPEQKLIADLFVRLKTKYKVVAGKDVNATGLAPGDTVETIAGKAVTAKEFEEIARDDEFEVRAEIADAVIDAARSALLEALITDEAKAANIDASAYIAREVSNKMVAYTDDERNGLIDALQNRLFAKYDAKILAQEPTPIVKNISVDDDPASGPANAPVTIVMFSDFQCPACSATHPLLKQAMAMFPGKIRFVVRDFPLESIHENAFRAALAAGAANAQGKFFEYAEILYTHQDALDAASLKRYAAELGLNAKQFELDSNSEKMAAEVRKDMADGKAYRIGSTPTIYINGVKARDLSVAGFKAAIERALKK